MSAPINAFNLCNVRVLAVVVQQSVVRPVHKGAWHIASKKRLSSGKNLTPYNDSG